MTLLSDYRRIKDGSARCSLRIREHILQQAPKVTYPDAYIAGVYEGLLDQALLMVDRLTGIDPEPVVDEIDAEISDLKAQIADIIITEKTTCNNCGGRMFISQFSSHIMVCHGPGGNGPGCGMRHDWHGVSTSNPIQIAERDELQCKLDTSEQSLREACCLLQECIPHITGGPGFNYLNNRISVGLECRLPNAQDNRAGGQPPSMETSADDTRSG